MFLCDIFCYFYINFVNVKKISRCLFDWSFLFIHGACLIVRSYTYLVFVWLFVLIHTWCMWCLGDTVIARGSGKQDTTSMTVGKFRELWPPLTNRYINIKTHGKIFDVCCDLSFCIAVSPGRWERRIKCDLRETSEQC